MYRSNVAAIVRREDGLILSCRRRDGRGWQLPQGGIEPGEGAVGQVGFHVCLAQLELLASGAGSATDRFAGITRSLLEVATRLAEAVLQRGACRRGGGGSGFRGGVGRAHLRKLLE